MTESPARERFLAALAHYGISEDDPVYRPGRAGNPYKGWCPICINHYDDRRVVRCDLEKARKADIEAAGFEAKSCFHCRQVFPVQTHRAALCPACYRRDQARTEETLAKLRRRPGSSSDGWSVRVPDGAGCSERIPRWMVDWDGNLGDG